MKDSDLAQFAKQALSNPALTEAFARYEAKIIELLRGCDDGKTEQIVTFKRHLTSLGVVKRNLHIMIEDGELARLDLEQKTFADRAKSLIRKIA